MDSKVKIYLDRSQNELRLAISLFNLSANAGIKEELGAYKEDTFYSATISHAYYAIFYSAKASLLTKNIETKSPEIHKKTFEEFKRVFADTGELDAELLTIYKKMVVRADELLSIFKDEKWKRGHYTYETIPQANIRPANDSINNTKKFLKHTIAYIENKS